MLRVHCLQPTQSPDATLESWSEKNTARAVSRVESSFPTTRLSVEKRGHRPPDWNVSSSRARSNFKLPLTLILSTPVSQLTNMPLPTFLLPLIQYLAIATPTLYAGEQPLFTTSFFLVFRQKKRQEKKSKEKKTRGEKSRKKEEKREKQK